MGKGIYYIAFICAVLAALILFINGNFLYAILFLLAVPILIKKIRKEKKNDNIRD